MANPIVEKIWFQVKNMKPSYYGYDGMEGVVNEYNVSHMQDVPYIKLEDVLKLIETYLDDHV